MGLRGRIAPTPTGYLHVGHARTFARAADRADGAGLVLRIEDLDGPRCRPEYTAAALEDLRWLGLSWNEGPDVGGPHGPYVQSQRTGWFLEVWRRLEAAGAIYPSPHSRRDVDEAVNAPHDTHPPSDTGHHEAPSASEGFGDAHQRPNTHAANASTPTPHRAEIWWQAPVSGESIFPASLRPVRRERAAAPGGVPWRFQVPDGRTIEFHDAIQGVVRRTAGIDFGDFVIWRRDDLAAYELAVVADDHAMEIDEVVRGADLLTSTARQILLHETLGWRPPAWCHAPLVCDAGGHRLAKRTGGLAIRDLRAAGWTPHDVLTRPLTSS